MRDTQVPNIQTDQGYLKRNLQRCAKAAWAHKVRHEEEANTKAAIAEQQAKARALQALLLENLGLEVTCYDDSVSVDCVNFCLRPGRPWNHLFVKSPCQTCGKGHHYSAGSIDSMADLGALLTSHSKGWTACDYCEIYPF